MRSFMAIQAQVVKIRRIEKNIESMRRNISNKIDRKTFNIHLGKSSEENTRKTFNKFTTDFLEKGIVKSNVVQIPKKDTSLGKSSEENTRKTDVLQIPKKDTSTNSIVS